MVTVSCGAKMGLVLAQDDFSPGFFIFGRMGPEGFVNDAACRLLRWC